MTDKKFKVPECIPRNRLTCDNGEIFDKGSDVMEYVYEIFEVETISEILINFKDLWVFHNDCYRKVEHAYKSDAGSGIIIHATETTGCSTSEEAITLNFFTRKEWAPEVGKIYGFCDNEGDIGVEGKFLISTLQRIDLHDQYVTREDPFSICFPINPELLGE